MIQTVLTWAGVWFFASVLFAVIWAFWHRHATGEKVWKSEPKTSLVREMAFDELARYAATNDALHLAAADSLMKTYEFEAEYDLEVDSHGQQ